MTSHPLFEKLRIFAPGPTPVPEPVLAELARSPLHHRTKEFTKVLERTREGLKFLFQTKEPVTLFSSSGTGAMEAAVVNLLSPGEEVLVIEGGKFGERWKKIATHFGLKAHVYSVAWGEAADPQEVEKILKAQPNVKAVLFQASETSTGVLHPVEAIAKGVQEQSDALLIVDAITALGVTDLPMDQWGLDAVIGGSQKALMLPPGLAFLALSERAQKRRSSSRLPRFYFDLEAEEKAASSGQTAWTPAVSLICGLDTVLNRMRSVKLSVLFSYFDLLARATREGMKALDLELLAKTHPSPAVTAVNVPSSIGDGKKIVSHLRDRFSITIAGGQNQLSGKIFRIGHLGFYDSLDVLTVIGAVEMTLKTLGHRFELGRGVGKAAATLLEN